jgi:gluconokinase
MDKRVAVFIIIMGVSGSGKTTIGQALAARLGCPFYDSDDFHPPANVAKMAAGIPLTDADRAGWLAALAAVIRRSLQKGEPGVMACSALKEKYRAKLCVDPDQVRFVYLKGSFNVILKRIQRRSGHYMQPALLESQFETLEEPQGAVVEEITLPLDGIVQDIIEQLRK